MVLIPFQFGDSLDQLRVFMRFHGQDEEGDGESGERFVLDLQLTNLGHMQLDGLIRRTGRHLDLIVRSEQPLPDEMRGGIREIFRNAAEVTGLDGGVNFQAKPPGFVEIAPQDVVQEHLGLVV